MFRHTGLCLRKDEQRKKKAVAAAVSSMERQEKRQYVGTREQAARQWRHEGKKLECLIQTDETRNTACSKEGSGVRRRHVLERDVYGRQRKLELTIGVREKENTGSA